MNFTDKKVSVNRAITILAKNGIEVNDDEATVIVDFLYLMAKNYKKDGEEKHQNPKKKSNFRKNSVKTSLGKFSGESYTSV